MADYKSLHDKEAFQEASAAILKNRLAVIETAAGFFYLCKGAAKLVFAFFLFFLLDVIKPFLLFFLVLFFSLIPGRELIEIRFVGFLLDRQSFP